MSEVFQTFNIPASLVATAVKITDALQNGHQGMFQSFFKDGAELGSDGDTPAVYVSTGYISDQSQIILGRTAMTEALADTDVTAQEISDFMDALDLTGDAPLERAQALDAERAVAEVFVPFSDGRRRAWLHEAGVVTDERPEEDGFRLSLLWTARQKAAFEAL